MLAWNLLVGTVDPFRVGQQMATATANLLIAQAEQRQHRWHSFKVVFGLTFAGIVLDIVTTAIGIAKVGMSYEKDPLMAGLLSHLTWIGVLVLFAAFAGVCFVSVRAVCFRMSPTVTGILTVFLSLGAVARWLCAGTAVLFILQTH